MESENDKGESNWKAHKYRKYRPQGSPRGVSNQTRENILEEVVDQRVEDGYLMVCPT